MSERKVLFYDTTMRDGAQSNWAMEMRYGTMDAIAGELDKAGYSYIELPVNPMNAKHHARFMKENPWDIARLLARKITRTKKNQWLAEGLDLLDYGEPRSVVKSYYSTAFRITGAQSFFYMMNTRNELDRHAHWVVPFGKSLGLTFCPCICYYPSPRLTDDYYANLTKRIMEYEPNMIWLKDAGGLMTVERLKTLLPAVQKEAKDVPLYLHTHGMSTNQGRAIVEAMELGIDGIHTCVPPLAFGSSHVSIFNAMHNAKVLGLKYNITNHEALREVERRLKIIGKVEGLPTEAAPLEYDHSVYKHQVPGGVITNLKEQLRQIGIPHKLDEVLDEVVRIIEDLGNPIMITPASQFIVSQAAVNVSVGERYKEVLDSMIETAIGVWGWEDAGVPWMDPNVRDKFLSAPNAKYLQAKWDRKQAEIEEEWTIEKVRADYGMTSASEEDFLLHYIMKGDTEIKQIPPLSNYKNYYTGREPLVLLLKELSKDHNISRLHAQKGNSFFEFRQ